MLMLALMEEAYPWAAVFSPYGNVLGGIVPAVGGSDPDPARCGAAPDSEASECLADIVSVAKPILRMSSLRDFASAVD
jgi:hypothetical protein